ncbi:MAG: hypothetical protein IJU44_10000 [Kiritimatiellae bacterium]|nr:hypothetical protein [Kiritimatiellia bacterium]
MTKQSLNITGLSIFLASVSFCGETRFQAELLQYTPGGNHSPLEITTGATAGIRFNATSPFISVKLICPSYNNSIGSLTFTLYRWQGSVEHSRQSGKLASNRFVNFRDNEKLALEFTPLPPGTYYAELSDPEEKVGVWESNSATNPQTASFFCGKPIDGTLELAIVFTDAKEPFSGDLALYEKLTGEKTCPEPTDGVSGTDGKLLPGIKFRERDLFADTWDAIDDLGRALTPAPRPPRRKEVGIFYWTWHEGNGVINPPRNNAELLAAKPSLAQHPEDPGWGVFGHRHHWDKPLFGYYQTTDKWVLRRHAQLLNAAGIDVAVFDATNGSFTWMDSTWALLETWSAMRRDGLRTPQFTYMLPFWHQPVQCVSLLQIYRDIYRPGKYRDLWHYWNGRPLVHANPIVIYQASLDPKRPEADRKDFDEILRFFTFRPLQAAYAVGPSAPNEWCWLEVFPQHGYVQKSGGGFEMCGAGVAQNHTWKGRDGRAGLAAMNDINVFGRAYMGPSAAELKPGERLRFAPDRNPRKNEPNRFMWGDNFSQQMAWARKIDPDYLFITGWNEWTAGMFTEWMGTKTAFPDQYAPEFSRDLEPSAGILKDTFYCLLVEEVRRFKGARPQRRATEHPVFLDAVHDTLPRDAVGYGNIRYTDRSGRNDIESCEVEHTDTDITFFVHCADAITPRTDPNWMRLFIALPGTTVTNRDWHGFKYAVNVTPPPDDRTAVLEDDQGHRFEVPMRLDGKTLSVTIPRKTLGLQGRKIDLHFKWADNTIWDNADGMLDFYLHGDAAPDGRFLYRYFE